MTTVLAQDRREMRGAAQFSDCGKYRYRLTRDWGQENGKRVAWCMLNPSTADESENDPTIRRCIGYSQDWGYDSLVVVNIYGYISTDPKGLHRTSDRVGPDNYQHLAWAFRHATETVFAWGAMADDWRVREVIALWESVYPGGRHMPMCLGITQSGHPRHPLYLKKEAARVVWDYR